MGACGGKPHASRSEDIVTEITGVNSKKLQVSVALPAGLVEATLDLHKLEVTSLRVVKLDLQFDDLSLSLSDGMSGFNPIFTLAGDQKVKMEAMVSKKVQSFAQEALSLMMPIKLPEQAVETAMFYP
ncbi:unnamed protein product [Polarella glacialis]|uniref:Uncharacterized protein n=1 Tax=Polarella glacialis TaxID=89957 RepID=A0A813F1P9_POLGL|nr:unnamed protein product [Polarella glacialis]